ncbi:MAG: ABC transporter permease [Sedimentisphaerales bacterium]|nr:ABC transporter permease [Sedimentisphaerales bacterium]
MRITDSISQAFLNLRQKKLRTFLTTFGVVIGIGALVCMFAFGQGIQQSITENFEKMELFHYITVFSATDRQSSRFDHHDYDPDEPDLAEPPAAGDDSPGPILDDALIERIRRLPGVETVFAEIRFPILVRFGGRENFCLAQVLDAEVCRSGLLQLRAGDYYSDQDPNGLLVRDSLLRRLRIRDPQAALGQTLELCSLRIDLGILNPWKLAAIWRGERLPFSTESYRFQVRGVTGRSGTGGAVPIRSDVFLSPRAARPIKKINLTSLREFFPSPDQARGYSTLSVKVAGMEDIETVQGQLDDWHLNTFALIDRLEEFKKGFLFMDMFLFAIGMIAITVAALGIINTMTMSILERYKEIGIMKAVGAAHRDVKTIFFFECGAIGLLGGLFGLLLGIAVSLIINQVINHFAVQQGNPYMDYFRFPAWLCLGGIAFSILISLLAGIYPTYRAAAVDPVVALRHD